MPASIAHFIPFEVRGVDMFCRVRFLTALGHGALVAVLRMEMVVYMAAEIGSSMKPWARANEDAIHKPFRAVIAIGSAYIRRDIVVTIWTIGSYADVNGYLRCGWGSGRCQADSSDSG